MAGDLELESISQRAPAAISDLEQLQRDAASAPDLRSICLNPDAVVSWLMHRETDPRVRTSLQMVSEAYKAAIERFGDEYGHLRSGISSALDRLQVNAEDAEETSSGTLCSAGSHR